ncbi:MAG: Lpg1974 family pore-forming outer membrane protein [Simkaniaceae bacterium]|nr:Lpg1974 family pore-forming outer membrane protein [Simkaniaceae bacterium]
MKKLLTLAVLATLQLTADNHNDTPPPIHSRTAEVKETHYHNGFGINLTADFLYMRYSAPQMLFAAEVDTVNNTTQGEVFSSTGRGRPGVELELCWCMHNDPMTALRISWFNIMAKFDRTVNNRNLSPVFISDFYAATNANARNYTTMNLNIFDIVITKLFSVGDYILMRPYGGFAMEFTNGKSTSWFNANSGSFRTGVTNAQFNQTVKFNGYGVQFGSEMWTKSKCGVYVFSDLAASLFWGNTDANMRLFENVDYTNVVARGKYNQNHGVFLLDGLIGLGYEYLFGNNDYAFNLHAGYRAQAFYPGWLEMRVELGNPLNWVSLFSQGLDTGITFRF